MSKNRRALNKINNLQGLKLERLLCGIPFICQWETHKNEILMMVFFKNRVMKAWSLKFLNSSTVGVLIMQPIGKWMHQ